MKHALSHLLHTLTNVESAGFSHLLFLGDVNLPTIKWQLNSSLCDLETHFYVILDDVSLSQLVDDATDLVVTNFPELSSKPVCFESTISSDHLTAYFEINIRGTKKQIIYHNVFNFKKPDFNKLILDLSNANLHQALNHDDISFCWSTWLNIIFKCINDNIPRVSLKKSSSPPWIDADIIHLSNKKNTVWYKRKKSLMLNQEEFPCTLLDSDNNSNPSLNYIQFTISEVRDILLHLNVTKS